MLRKVVTFFVGVFLFSSAVGADAYDYDFIEKYRYLPPQQLNDTAEYYFLKGSNDTALMCYSLLVNIPVKEDGDARELVIQALNKSGVIYYYMYDYRKSYEFLIKALDLCELYGYTSYRSKIFTNIGNIYYRFNRYDMAQNYYLDAFGLCEDSVDMVVLSNNIGSVEYKNGELDSALYFIDKSLQLSQKKNKIYLHGIQNNKALIHARKKQYDSAFHYFRLSLAGSGQDRELEAINLSDMGRLFLEIGRMDSASYYAKLSNRVAEEVGNWGMVTDNYLILSEIEEAKGDKSRAFAYFKTYAHLKDSLFNMDKLDEINQLQRVYEISKTDQQIERFVMEQQIKERTIRYRTISLNISLCALLLVSCFFVFLYVQNKKLNRAYKVLFEKNLKIIEIQKDAPERKEKNVLSENMQNELLNKILLVMEDTTVICDTEFSLDKLSMLVQSNHSSVSQAINSGLNKNFRSFLNGYRIREAQRLLSLPDAAKYTIEAVALKVGFKSRNGFSNIFKEITGVSPNFYLKSLQEQSLRIQADH